MRRPEGGSCFAVGFAAQRGRSRARAVCPLTRRIVLLLAVLFLTLFSAPPAFAIEPPAIDPSALPPDETGPDQPTELRRVCSSPTIFPGANFADKPWANDYLKIARRPEVRNRRRRNCRRHRHRGERLAPGSRPAGRRLRRQGRRRDERLRQPRDAHRFADRRAACADRRIHRHGARRAAPVAAPDVGQLSAGGCAHRPERPEHDPHRRLVAQPRPRDRARGQPRRAGHQHQRGGLLQDHPADRREEPRRRHRVRGQRQGRGHHRRGGQHRAGLRPEPAARRVDTVGSPRLEAGSDDRVACLVLPAGAHGRRNRPDRAAEHVLDVRPVGRSGRTRREHHRARITTAIPSTRCRARTDRSRSTGRRSPPRTSPASPRCSSSGSPT